MPARRPLVRLQLGALWVLLGVAALYLVGCAGIYQDPGPQPARLVAPVMAQVTPQQRADAAEPYGGLSWAGFAPRYNQYSEPLWNVQAFIVAADGASYQLGPAPGAAVHGRAGYTLNTTAEFLVPPGTHKIRLLVTSNVRRTYTESFSQPDQHQYLGLYARELVQSLEFCPGCTVRVEGLARR
jgi:hypothetical protein